MHNRNRFLAIYEALSSARESRDDSPSRYQGELMTLVGAVTDKVGLSDDQREEVLEAAALHDIGKLGLSAGLIGSQGEFSSDDRAHAGQYAVISARILETLPGFEDAAAAVRYLSEHWDGSGYPDGLAGEDIPLASRLLSVVVAYLAMSSPRPHRPARHPADICAELEASAGSQFDPELVEALVSVIRPHLDDA